MLPIFAAADADYCCRRGLRCFAAIFVFFLLFDALPYQILHAVFDFVDKSATLDFDFAMLMPLAASLELR